MFKALAHHARIAPVHLTLFEAEDGQLRVIIAQKRAAEDKTHRPLSLAITATPEDLDAELPLALAEFAAAPTKSIADQVKAQAAAIAGGDDDDLPGDTKPAKLPTVGTPKKATAKKTAPAAKAKAAKKPAAKAEPAMKTPVIKPLIKAPAPARKTAADIKADKRAACLADLDAAIAQHGAAVTRKQYAAMAKTGRSFETVFGSWEKFRAEVPATGEASASAAPAAEPTEQTATQAIDGAIGAIAVGLGVPAGELREVYGPARVEVTTGVDNAEALSQARIRPTPELTPPGESPAATTADIF